LEHAEAEAKTVAKLYDVTPLIGPDATIENVKPLLSGSRILLFATHGVMYEDAPLLSGIALADGYMLTVQELMGLRLDAELITVSACRSGLGVRTRGEEIVGLTRGLLAAGGSAAMVTLWPVFDASAAVLVVKFHEILKESDDAASALRHAQAWLRGLTAEKLEAEKGKLRDIPAEPTAAVPAGVHPQHWAPFVLVGG
jgi:CHAT domain-containing protein